MVLLKNRHSQSSFWQRGLSKITALILIIVFSAGVYTASKIMPFYYYYFELQNQFEQLIRLGSIEKDDYIRKRIYEMIDWYQVPAQKSKLSITRNGTRMTIKLPYKEVFFIRFRGKDYDIKVFEFEPYAVGSF